MLHTLGAICMAIWVVTPPLAPLISQDDQSDKKRIEELIQKLGSEVVETRGAATAALKELGEKGRSAIQKGLRHRDAEVRARCQMLLEWLDREDWVPAWTVKGKWSAVAPAPDGHGIYAVQRSGDCVMFDAAGKEKGRFSVGRRYSQIRTGRFSKDGPAVLVGFSTWSTSIRAYDSKGKELWSYAPGHAIDDVWLSDLDGDGVDEVIAGYNGRGGIRVIDAKGELVWANESIGNVWTVGSGDLDKDGTPEVVSTSARGWVHVFDNKGGKIKDLKPRCYADKICVVPSSDTHGALLLAGDSGLKVIKALDPEGTIKWEWNAAIGGDHRLDSIQVSPFASRLAVTLTGGHVFLLDVRTGKQLFQFEAGGSSPSVSWVKTKKGESPILTVCTSGGLKAYHLRKKK